MSQGKIKVFLVDNHPVVRRGVRAYLAGRASVAVVGEASNGLEALRRLSRLAADVVVAEAELPVLDGGEVTKRLLLLRPGAKVLVFSALGEREHVTRMALCGARGYVTKDRSPACLLEAIGRVHRGGLCFPAGLDGSGKDGLAALTPRERQVLGLLADGLANKEVGHRLGISVRTAETHREHLSHKLDLRSAAALTRFAIQQGLSPLS